MRVFDILTFWEVAYPRCCAAPAVLGGGESAFIIVGGRGARTIDDDDAKRRSNLPLKPPLSGVDTIGDVNDDKAHDGLAEIVALNEEARRKTFSSVLLNMVCISFLRGARMRVLFVLLFCRHREALRRYTYTARESYY